MNDRLPTYRDEEQDYEFGVGLAALTLGAITILAAVAFFLYVFRP